MRYVAQKLLQLVVVLLLVTFLTFLLLNLLPGGPETAALGVGADEEQIAEFREEQDLERPHPGAVRAAGSATRCQGDLGESPIINDVDVGT